MILLGNALERKLFKLFFPFCSGLECRLGGSGPSSAVLAKAALGGWLSLEGAWDDEPQFGVRLLYHSVPISWENT